MTNLEKHLVEILAEDAWNTIYKLREGKDSPANLTDSTLERIIEDNKKWLKSECIKPQTDWTKVKSGTMIKVKGHSDPVRFVGFWNGEVFFTTKDGEWHLDHNNYYNLTPSKVSSCEREDCEEIEVE